MRIIGIDPGLRHTGWGIIDNHQNCLKFVASGTIKTSSSKASSTADRLCEIYQGLEAVIQSWHAQEAAVEQTFVNSNGKTTLLLGQARGVALLAPAQAGLQVAEYSANLIKKSVVGAGHADKNQIAMMVKVLLPAAETGLCEHADDALAIAICHANHRTRSLGDGGGYKITQKDMEYT